MPMPVGSSSISVTQMEEAVCDTDLDAIGRGD